MDAQALQVLRATKGTAATATIIRANPAAIPILLLVTGYKDKDAAKPGAKPPPSKTFGVPLESKAMAHKVSVDDIKKGVKTSDLPPVQFEPGGLSFMSKCWENVDVRPGTAVVLRGCMYEDGKGEWAGRGGPVFSDVMLAPEHPFEYVTKIPFARRSIDRERDAWKPEYVTLAPHAFVAVVVDEAVLDDNARPGPPVGVPDALKFEDGVVTGYFTLPTDNPRDSTWFCSTNQNTKVKSPVFSAEGKRNTLTVVQIAPDGAQTRFAVASQLYETDVVAMKLSAAQWYMIGPNIMPHLRGLLIGTVNRKDTANAVSVPGDYDGVLALRSHFICDWATTARRAFVPVDADVAATFVDFDCEPEPRVIVADSDLAVNLTLAKAAGHDLAGILASPDLDFFVGGNWDLDTTELAELAAEPMARRAERLAGRKAGSTDKGLVKYLGNQLNVVFCVPKPGAQVNLRALLGPIPPPAAKRARA